MDAARALRGSAAVEAMLQLPLDAGLCTTAELRAELGAGNRRDSAMVRFVLRDLTG